MKLTQHQKILLYAAKHNDRITIAEAQNLGMNSASKRMSELRAAGLVKSQEKVGDNGVYYNSYILDTSSVAGIAEA